MTDYIIGKDISSPESKDFSALSMICKNCNTVIHCEIFEGEELTLETPKICPNCSIVFK